MLSQRMVIIPQEIKCFLFQDDSTLILYKDPNILTLYDFQNFKQLDSISTYQDVVHMYRVNSGFYLQTKNGKLVMARVDSGKLRVLKEFDFDAFGFIRLGVHQNSDLIYPKGNSIQINEEKILEGVEHCDTIQQILSQDDLIYIAYEQEVQIYQNKTKIDAIKLPKLDELNPCYIHSIEIANGSLYIASSHGLFSKSKFIYKRELIRMKWAKGLLFCANQEEVLIFRNDRCISKLSLDEINGIDAYGDQVGVSSNELMIVNIKYLLD